MKEYIDSHAGEHALICGNGPSIRQHGFEWYDEWPGPTFGVNRICYWFTPRYYFNVYRLDNHFCDNANGREVAFDWCGHPHSINLTKDGGLTFHGSIAMTAIGAAYQMGCTKISLIGIDLKPAQDGRLYFYELPGHKHETYLTGDAGKWTLIHFQEAIKMLSWRGVEVENLSKDSLL